MVLLPTNQPTSSVPNCTGSRIIYRVICLTLPATLTLSPTLLTSLNLTATPAVMGAAPTAVPLGSSPVPWCVHPGGYLGHWVIQEGIVGKMYNAPTKKLVVLIILDICRNGITNTSLLETTGFYLHWLYISRIGFCTTIGFDPWSESHSPCSDYKLRLLLTMVLVECTSFWWPGDFWWSSIPSTSS